MQIHIQSTALTSIPPPPPLTYPHIDSQGKMEEGRNLKFIIKDSEKREKILTKKDE